MYVSMRYHYMVLKRFTFETLAIQASSLSPMSGQSGSVIVLTGNFPPRQGDNSSVTAVHIGNIPTNVLVIPTQVTFMLVVQAGPSQTSMSGANITVMSNYSSFLVMEFTFTYIAPGNITMVAPSQGQRGTRIVITGENLDVPEHVLTQVLLAGTEATVENNNNTMIVCRVMSGSSNNGSIVLRYIRNVNGMAYDGPTIIRNNSWQQVADGVINRIVPSSAAVNQTVFVCGERLLGGGNRIVSVLIGTVNATQFNSTTFTIQNLICINVTLPSGVTGSLPITLTADTGAIIESMVNVSIASISSVNRSFGQYGTRVNITGVELFRNLSNTSVVLAGVDAMIEMADTTSRGWIVARAGRPPLLSRIVMTQNCSIQEICIPVTNITSNCPTINCSTNFDSNATFLMESCLTTCFNQNVSVCFTSCIMDGMLNETCFIECENSTAITTNSSICFTNCSMSCCINQTTINCTNMTVYENVNVTEMYEGAFSGQVAIVTEELGVTFNLTNSSLLWTYNISGRIANVTPSFGQLGTRVALNGTNLFGYGMSLQELLINRTMATIFSENSTDIVFGAPNITSGSNSLAVGLVDIQLISDTGAIVEMTEGFEYREAGMIISLEPAVGQRGTYGKLELTVSIVLMSVY